MAVDSEHNYHRLPDLVIAMPNRTNRPTRAKRANASGPGSSILARLARFSTATLVESLHDYSAALPSAIKPIDPPPTRNTGWT